MNPFFEIFSDPELIPVIEAARLARQTPEEIIALISVFKQGLNDRS